jgi:hypothetical protein
VLKLLVLPFLASAGLAGWSFFGTEPLGARGVEAALASQMNGTEAGVVTRSVRCAGKSEVFQCVLTSTRGTTLRARVHVDGREWRADWAPLSG